MPSRENYTTISVSFDTKDRLEELRQKRETFDQLIKRLIGDKKK